MEDFMVDKIRKVKEKRGKVLAEKFVTAVNARGFIFGKKGRLTPKDIIFTLKDDTRVEIDPSAKINSDLYQDALFFALNEGGFERARIDLGDTELILRRKKKRKKES